MQWKDTKKDLIRLLRQPLSDGGCGLIYYMGTKKSLDLRPLCLSGDFQLEAEITPNLLPQRGFPAIDLKLFRIQGRDRHSRRSLDNLVGDGVF